MSNLEAMDHRLTFDAILEAVQESKRGRWFLQEYEQRFQKQDTTSILQAISKLEARMDGFGAQSGQPDELGRVKTAIANARHDLLKLGLGKEALSTEGQLFAHLAEMARKTLPAGNDGNGVVRTLQLVAEIENSISTAPPVDRGSKFFGADENLFERAAPTATKPVLVAATPIVTAPAPTFVAEQPPVAPKEEPAATGAKLIIRKTTAQEAITEAQAVPPINEAVVIETAPAAVVTSAAIEPAPADELTAINTPRIVIIRRKAEDMPEVEAVSAA